MTPEMQEWRENLGDIIARLRSVYDERFSSIKEFSQFLRDEGIEPNSERTLHDYLNEDTTRNKPDLEWLLQVADALGIKYAKLFHGGTGWEGTPVDRYRIHLPNGKGEVELQVPHGWDQIDWSVSNLPVNEVVDLKIEQVAEEKKRKSEEVA